MVNGAHSEDVCDTAWPSVVEGEMSPERGCGGECAEGSGGEMVGYVEKNVVREVTESGDSRHWVGRGEGEGRWRGKKWC